MKPLMLFSIIIMSAIILAASFGLHIMPTDPIYQLEPEVAASALYICPAADPVWDSIAMGLRPYIRYINMFFFFIIMLLIFGWGWALYQNLLKDNFNKDAFNNPWAFTKTLFWAAAVVMILLWTPNGYKTVHVQGTSGNWIFCEENTPGAIPVLAAAVKR